MRTLWALCLSAILGLMISCGLAVGSEGFDDIAKLAKSGVGDDVLLAFIQASPVAYQLGIDEIVYLRDVGVSDKMIQSIMDHGNDIRAGKAPVVVADDANLKPLDTTTPVVADPNAPDPNAPTPVVDPAVAADPNAQGTEPVTYASPLTGDTSSTPELITASDTVRETVAAPTPVEACTDCTISHFYETLTPYGTWVDIDGTWCWQPSVCAGDPSWRPYCHRGHWVWTDSGWCWASDYSWGWAPFHYGRWFRAPGYGWLWAPDTVWGPAWVNWRESDAVWGWAPLPPAARFETDAAIGVGFHIGGRNWGLNIGAGYDFGLGYADYAFVPREHFVDVSFTAFLVPPERHYAIYRQTVIIQNSITYDRAAIFVHGPRAELVIAATHHDLIQVRLADNEVRAGAILGRGTFERNGVLTVYRPHVNKGPIVSPKEIAALQLAKYEAHVTPVANPKVLAAAARADELRERQFATQDARRQEMLLGQSERIEEAAAKRSDFEQMKINKAMATANTAEQKAALAAKLADERKRAEDARLQKESIQKQAVEQRKLADQLTAERDRVARATATTESLKAAEATKAQLAAQRAAREQAQRDAALQSQKARQDQAAKIAAAKATAKNDVEAKQLASEAERKAKLDADRTAREANIKAQSELAAKQRAQLEADRQSRLNGRNNPPANNSNANNPPANSNTAAELEAERKAKLDAERAARLKAQQDAAAERGNKKPTGNNPNNWPLNPKTGAPYDPSNPNDPNNPKKGK
ncbi:MAG TPA: DUF6600 domain-containing protein [Planctomycetota bacterium]|nr:DUF6600 domain-containing protein [Planctomycetota bacterium]